MRFTATAEEQLAFTTSPLLEAVHSWHVIAGPGHHALHLPWVRRCRELPTALRRLMREHSFVVADYIPAFFESRADDLDASFEEQLTAIRSVPPEHLAAELAQTIVDTTRYHGRDLVRDAATRDRALAELDETAPDRAETLRGVLTDPTPVTEAALTALQDYWDAAFGAEWERIEPSLHHALAQAGRRIAHGGVLPILRTLIPQIRIDPRQRLLRLDRPHDHDITVTEAQPVTFTASHYVWPHVRVTCDEPWPLRVTFPSVPLGPAPATASREEILTALRALAAAPRLQIAESLSGQSRSTQELATLLGLSESVVSRHLKQMTQAGLMTTRREGYYVLYSLDHRRLNRIANALIRLADSDAAPTGS
ncbi:ArsR/SmtB family transcription factor [Streptomyces sp. SS]|uniref:ArsR/SmtB family transcription factor n=1 Tax=Streptomyces sp. SS TaxID=260742 RepID=UPI001ED995E4|nr:DUF5937 family protein [Streptomyces sp. SS]